jgi:hypothetical protein
MAIIDILTANNHIDETQRSEVGGGIENNRTDKKMSAAPPRVV